MILTYKIKHNKDFSEELRKAKQVAYYAVKNKNNKKFLTTKYVKHFGLKSTIANQILRKYGNNKTIKEAKRVNLIIPGRQLDCHWDKDKKEIYISSLKLKFNYQFPTEFEKINQIEISDKYIFVAVTVFEKKEVKHRNSIGVDLNSTGHVAVVANPKTGKIIKLGKEAPHIKKKYKSIREKLQAQDKHKKIKNIKNKEARKTRDLNHKISRKIVNEAKESRCGIKLEDLSGITKRVKTSRANRASLNSWSFYQLRAMIEYKAKLLGIPVTLIDPAYTSQDCSKCGLRGNRTGKSFKCPHCGHVDHADVNAAFNIAKRQGIDQSAVERDAVEGSAGTPKEAPCRNAA